MGYSVPGRPPQPTSHCPPTQLPSSTTSQVIQAVYFSTSPHHPEYRGQADHGGVHQYTQLQHKPNDLKQKQVVEAVNVAALDVNNVDVPDTTPTAMVDYSDRDCLLPGIPRPAQPLVKPSTLENTCYVLPGNVIFVDKILPPTEQTFKQNAAFPLDYFVGLYNLVSAPNLNYPSHTPNYCGARLPLQHTGLNIARWRYHLTGYEGSDIIQYLQYGFPLGLSDNPPPLLAPTLRNHGSSYQYYPHLDEFISTGLARCEVAGPCLVPPFNAVHISPLMTAVKKPDSRRAVFDATFGEYSLNNGTPTDVYLNHPFSYDFPKVEDFKSLVLKCGYGCYLYKRDLSRYYLQLPVDPVEYPLLCFIWRRKLYFFVALMFGLRHAGLQGQKVTTAVTWVHQRLGLESDPPAYFNSLNYSDDIGGCEATLSRATEAFEKLGELLADLGLCESSSKAHQPATKMPYLGIMFDTTNMRMSIPPEKVAEVRELISLWMKRSFATKKTLQQLLGKLLWVSKCVKFSRSFLGRLLTQLQGMHNLTDNKRLKLSPGSKEDIIWWDRYLRRFNGVEILYPTDPLKLSLQQLLDTSALVNCGDAQMNGGGSYFGTEYWSRPFPAWLQADNVPIHLKEFWVVIASAWLWGDKWQGNMVYIFCDNTAVVEVLSKEKPRDPRMLELLREFLYIVCTRRFTPVFRKISTSDNYIADFISRCHDHTKISNYFLSKALPVPSPVKASDNLFTLQSNW